MPTLTARHALSSIWLLIFNARNRLLSEDERTELARLCELLPTIPGRDDFNNAAEEFCQMLLCCETGVTKATDRMLEYVDELRDMLNPDQKPRGNS